MYAALQSQCYKVVFIRHGESEYNQENRFCGWVDADLSARGECEAKQAGQMIKQRSMCFDVAYTSVLSRAIKTCHYVLEELGLLWIPIHKTWRLNERMYGALQGLDKAETAAKHGEAQVKLWRRSYDIPPPPLDVTDSGHPLRDQRYALLDSSVIPKTESLKNTVDRVLPFWFDEIVPAIKAGKRVLIAAHGNSIRALIKYLENISDKDIIELTVPTGIPLVYELNADMKPVKHYYLADDETVAAAISRSANINRK
uniref:phosphoglycerate mutase (2,3-diphosphoglycerate-dependent) n=2 Tax=Schistocephalus solidus TaxID=70667 RepID=A0A0X3QCX8_SCHSO